MPRGGSKPGERRGGRQKGSRNKLPKGERALVKLDAAENEVRALKAEGFAPPCPAFSSSSTRSSAPRSRASSEPRENQNIALEPQRKREILDRVVRLRTPLEALAFLKEVKAKLESSRTR